MVIYLGKIAMFIDFPEFMEEHIVILPGKMAGKLHIVIFSRFFCVVLLGNLRLNHLI